MTGNTDPFLWRCADVQNGAWRADSLTSWFPRPSLKIFDGERARNGGAILAPAADPVA